MIRKDPICHMEVDESKALTVTIGSETFYFCSKGCKDKFQKARLWKQPRRSYDLIIIGGGPAGLTAAVYSATLKTDTFLIASDIGGQAIDSSEIENYMGYDFITGPDLVTRFQHQLIHSHYVDHVVGTVEKIYEDDHGFAVITSDLKEYSAKALIVATGMTRRQLKVAGEEEFQRRGIFYGNIQDFSFLHDENAVVIGGGNSALQIVRNLSSVARSIFVVSDYELSGDQAMVDKVKKLQNLTLYEGYKVLEFRGEDTLSHVVIRKMASEETVTIPAKGAFIAIGLKPNSSVVSLLVDLNGREEIRIKPDCSTSHRGIYAAGDVTDAFGKRIIIASGEGAKAAMAVRQYLLNLKAS